MLGPTGQLVLSANKKKNVRKEKKREKKRNTTMSWCFVTQTV